MIRHRLEGSSQSSSIVSQQGPREPDNWHFVSMIWSATSDRCHCKPVRHLLLVEPIVIRF